MRTTTVASTTATSVEEDPGAVGRRATAKYRVHLIGMLVLDAAVLLAGVGLTGFTWQALCLLLLPPMLAGAGAGITALVLNRMALPSIAPLGADSRFFVVADSSQI